MNSTDSHSSFETFRKLTLLVLTPHCFDNYFIKYNFFDGPCFSATLSKALGLGIILGSLLVKLPQIVKIVRNKSGEGISLLSVTLDLTAITIYASYSFVKAFPFSAWGDSSFLAVQTVLIGVLVLYYANKTPQSTAYLLGYLIICYILMGGVTPVSTLWTLQGCNIPIVLAGKLTQAYTNYKNGHTGQLSAATCFMLFFGSTARIFTSIQETGDSMVIITYVAATVANLVVVVQMLYYWNVDVSKTKTE